MHRDGQARVFARVQAPLRAASVAEAPADPSYLDVPTPCRVLERVQETEDTFSLVIEAPRGYSFLPGQFNMLYVPGVGEAAISLSGDPAESATLQHTIRAVGRVTRRLSQLIAGERLYLRGPFGTAWPLAAGRELLIVAGGIGLAPLLPAIYRAAAAKPKLGRILVAYGARSPKDILFSGELAAWQKKPNFTVAATVDRASPAELGAQGLELSTGVVTKLLSTFKLDPKQTSALICGPEVMMRFAARELQRLGLSRQSLFISLERNMSCAVARCGHCQFGSHFLCREGPVLPYDRVCDLMTRREL